MTIDPPEEKGCAAGPAVQQEPMMHDAAVTDAFGLRRESDVENNGIAAELNEDDIVEIASMDSFPASDPPAWTLGRDRGTGIEENE